jgi:uncharacterized protein (TIGR03086 family)
MRSGTLEALDHQGILHSEYPEGSGRDVDTFVGRMIGDALIHTWDLARAVGGDEHLDPDLVPLVSVGLEHLSPAMRAPGRYGDAIEAPAGADAQTRMLALAGRRSW